MSPIASSLADRSAVITGGGRGIGAAIAAALAERGVRVLVSARSADQIEAVADELREGGAEAHAVPCDVSDPAEVRSLAEQARELLGPVDILVNNAGFAPSAPLAAIDLEGWHQVFAVNVTGTLLCSQAFAPGMADRGWGRVVNVASIAGRVGAPYIAAYAATKHAVVGLTRALGAEMAKSGVTVNAVCPGYVDTPLTEASIARIVDKTGISEDDVLQHMRESSPQGRLMDPSEVAYLVVCLCEDDARGINAQAIVVDGGGVQA